MALRVFETGDAKYYLGLGNHAMSSAIIFDDVDFSKIDMFIFEDVGNPRCLMDLSHGHKQYRDLYNRAVGINPGIAIYGVDVNPGVCNLFSSLFFEGASAVYGGQAVYRSASFVLSKRKELSRRGFLKNVGLIAGGLFLANQLLAGTYCYSERGMSTAIKLNSLRTSILPSSIVGFRNAVTAKKVSEYLVPRHKTGNKKVEVALIYGAMHSGIETELFNPTLADLTNELYYNKLDCCTKREMNDVREHKTAKDGHKYVISYDCGLF
ncbi:MAG: twin-arginine translocation signal domain-containing protein [archaeon]